MNSTQLVDLEFNKRKQNWQYVDLMDRDLLLFKTVLEQKFLTRFHVIHNVFKGMKSYAEIRIRKLKKFDYLKPIHLLVGEPESYLLSERSVQALKEAGYVIGTMGFPLEFGVTLPEPQEKIELAFYDHDKRVTNVRFLFEALGFCKDWHSEKVLKLGQRGERKVPDGFFTRNGKGIAIEVELTAKKAETYRKIFEVYTREKKIDYIFYICGDLSIRKKIMELSRGKIDKPICFTLYDNLIQYREKTNIKIHEDEFELKRLLG